MMQALRTRPTLRRSGLLKLPEDVLAALRENGLSERHGRALLRLPDADSQRAALEHILEKDLTVAAADAYVDALLTAPEPPARPSPAEAFLRRGSLFAVFSDDSRKNRPKSLDNCRIDGIIIWPVRMGG